LNYTRNGANWWRIARREATRKFWQTASGA